MLKIQNNNQPVSTNIAPNDTNAETIKIRNISIIHKHSNSVEKRLTNKKNMLNQESITPDNSTIREKAARVIQHAFTNWADKKVIKKDASIFDLQHTNLKNADDIFKMQSKVNLNKIQSELGELTSVEKLIQSKIEALHIRFRHQTNIELDKLEQDSQRIPLLSAALTGKEHFLYKGEFIGRYIYTAMEFSEKPFDDNTPLKTTYDCRDFGAHAFFIDESALQQRPCFITLANIRNTTIKSSNFDTSMEIFDNFYPSRVYNSFERNIFFTPENIRAGIALYLIKNIREILKWDLSVGQEITHKLVFSNGDSNNFQPIINSLMEPEVHIPRVLRTEKFTKTQFRKYTIEEVLTHNKIDMLLNTLTKKSHCIEMLAELLEGSFNKEQRKKLKPIYDKVFSNVTRNDLNEIKTAYAQTALADLTADLCYKWNNDNRELLLKHGIIKLSDQLSKPFYDYKSTTMKKFIKEMRRRKK